MTEIAYRIQASVYRDVSARILPFLPAETEVIIDSGEGAPNPWRGFRKCLESVPAGVKHAVILQDDVFVSINFTEAVARIAEAKPGSLICLFLPAQRMRTTARALQAMKRGERYVRVNTGDFVPVVGTLWPRPLIDEFLAWIDENRHKLPGKPQVRSDDAVLGRWMRLTNQHVLACLPSLVQHPNDVKSTIGKAAGDGQKGRIALAWIEGANSLEIDWS